MDMSWLVRDMNDRAVEEVRIQHVFTPGLPEEIRTEKMKKRKFAKAEMYELITLVLVTWVGYIISKCFFCILSRHIPFYFILDIFYIWASFLSVVIPFIVKKIQLHLVRFPCPY